MESHEQCGQICGAVRLLDHKIDKVEDCELMSRDPTSPSVALAGSISTLLSP